MKTTQCIYLPPEELFGAVEQLLQDGCSAVFTVTGNSMWPFLTHGRDQVTLQSIAGHPLKTGDILLFCPEQGRYLLHRVIQVQENQFRTAGDGNCYCDGRFPVECVIGRVTEFSRKGHQLSCQNICYRLCSRIWIWIFPIRRPLLWLLRIAAKGKRYLQ